MNIISITKVKILMFIKWLYRSPSLVLTIEHMSYFEHVVQFLLKTHAFIVIVLRGTPNQVPLKYMHFDKKVTGSWLCLP